MKTSLSDNYAKKKDYFDAYRAAHREEARLYARAYHAKNRDRINAKRRIQYYLQQENKKHQRIEK